MNDRLLNLLAEILDVPSREVHPDMRRSETQTWDSLNHLRLITAIEGEFGTTFTMEEIAELQTPAELQQVIEERASSSSHAE